jgi:hypothetical protein
MLSAGGVMPSSRPLPQVIPNAEGIERSYVFDTPDLTAMPTTAANGWMSAA